MDASSPYKTYWRIWGVLLILTLFMILFEALDVPPAISIIVLVLVMMFKASLIGGWFMHLKNESTFLVITLVAGTLLTIAFLFFLLVPDATAAVLL